MPAGTLDLAPRSLLASRRCPAPHNALQTKAKPLTRAWPDGAGRAGGSGAAGAGGEGAGGSGSGEGGMWLALSQVQEWVLEFCADMLYISIRTDVAWYRLTQCVPRPPASLARWRHGLTAAAFSSHMPKRVGKCNL